MLDATPENILYISRRRIISKVQSFWVDNILLPIKLDGHLIDIPLNTITSKVYSPLQEIHNHSLNSELQFTSKTIHEVYEHFGGELLILGESGSGKSITLLILLREILEKASNNEDDPIPLIFNLGSWND